MKLVVIVIVLFFGSLSICQAASADAEVEGASRLAAVLSEKVKEHETFATVEPGVQPHEASHDLKMSLHADSKPSVASVELAKPTLEKVSTEAGLQQEKEIYLNFENTSLINFVNYMAELKKVNLIPCTGLDASKISLTIRDPLTLDGAWNIFLTVLETSGFSLVTTGNVCKVLPKDKKLTEALPAYINIKAEDLPESDLTIRYVTFLQNVQVSTLEDLLKSMLSDKSLVYTHKESNGFIITDKAYNIRSAIKVIASIDQMGQPETVVVMRLQRANATETPAPAQLQTAQAPPASTPTAH